MVHKLIAMVSVVALSFSAAAHAANWIDIGTDVEGSIWYVDSTSIRGSANARYVWVKVDASADPSVTYFTAKRQFKINCTKWTSRLISWATYDANEKLLESDTEPDYSSDVGMKPIIPETMGESVAQAACGRR